MGSMQESQPAVRMSPRRLAHGNIFVSDLERSIAFYESVCGVQGVFREPGIMAGFHSNGNSHHDLGIMQAARVERRGRDGHVQVSTERGHTAGLNHLGFEMESEADLVAAWQRASVRGIQMRTTDHGMSHSIYVFDPEGNYLEFYADMIDDWRAFYAAKENQLISGGWNPDPATASRAKKYTTTFEPTVVPGAPARTRRISRATLLVDDFSMMFEYYSDFAGLKCMAGGREAGYAVFHGAAGEPTLALFPRGEHKRGLHHFGFELPDEAAVDAAVQGFVGKGIALVARPEHAAKKSVVIADPDGMLIEFYAARAASLPEPSAMPVAERLFLI
jgi:catechol 2,3-dioxygenase